MTRPITEQIIRRLFLKVLLFQALLLVLGIFLSSIMTAHFKQRLGSQLAAAFRNDLIMGDTRKAMLELPKAIRGDFSGAKWSPSGSSQPFSVPENIGLYKSLTYNKSVVTIFFDENRTSKCGELIFYYHRWMPALWALILWALLFAASVPIWLREKTKIEREYSLSVKAEIGESRATMAAQVAHDIRSPLAALGAAAKGLSADAEQRKLIEGAVGRMQGIADDLLARYRAPGAAEAKAKLVVMRLAGIVEQVVEEKRLQHAAKVGVKINFESAGGELKAEVEAKELQRAVSNLVNNAVEAFEKGGTVLVKVSALDGRVLIAVKDDGKGIPADVLAKLGGKGETHGKAGGTGLGLYHAKTSAESWGGSLKIESEPGRGTTVTMELPRAGVSDNEHKLVVLLDDDALVHMNWSMAAKSAGAELKSFKTPEELEAAREDLPKGIPIYIDAELGDGAKGDEVAQRLREKGFTDITMATGHSPDKFAGLPWLKVRGKEPPWNS